MCNVWKEIKYCKKKFNDQEISSNLSSFEMWSMVIESGLNSEHTPPPTKEKRFSTLIPDTLKIVRYNGAYMALKFQALLSQNGFIFPRTGFIAYPDETNNLFNYYNDLTADKVPSNLFISSLKLMYEYNILPIPRHLIEKIKETPSFLDEIKTNYKDFYNLLLMIKNEPVIIVDEFPLTYRTYEAMRKILFIEGKIPLAYFTIFNFSPDQVRYKIEDSIKHLNFYEFQFDEI